MIAFLALAIAAPPNAVTGVVDVVASYAGDPGCLVKTDGSVWCWRETPDGLDGPLPGPIRVEGVSGTGLVRLGQQICVLTTRGADCLPASEPVLRFGKRRVLDASGNGSWSCVLLDDRTVECQGLNLNGEIGRPPVRQGVAGGIRSGPWAPVDAAQGAVGLAETCAVLETGALVCWGPHALGPVRADPDAAAAYVEAVAPRNVGPTDITDAEVAPNRACVVRKDRSVLCFTRPKVEAAAKELPLDLKGVVEVGRGLGGFVFRTDSGELYGWDGNAEGELERYRVTEVKSFSGVPTHLCVVTKVGHARCLGQNDAGQLGDGTLKEAAEATWVVDHRPELAPGPKAEVFGCSASDASRRACAKQGLACVMSDPPGYWRFGGGGAKCDAPCMERLGDELDMRPIPTCLCTCDADYREAEAALQRRLDQPPPP
ncbi:MAG: hypothetical protein H6737_27870 [Alphaproteobacteria bacterium]|nr:hypothetical protein [Alphaproteobacteria bacterium]